MKIAHVLFLSSFLLVGAVYGSTECTRKSEPVADSTSTPHQFTGVSLGVHGGFIHMSAKSRYTYTNDFNIAITTPGYGGVDMMSGYGGLAGAHGGYGYVFANKFYVGGEATASYYFVKGVTRNNAYFGKHVTYRQKDSYTVALRVGGVVSNSLLYIKAGTALTNRVLQSEYPRLMVPNYQSRKYVAGFLMGLGTEIPLNQSVLLGLETNFIKYKKDPIIHKLASDYDINTGSIDIRIRLSFIF